MQLPNFRYHPDPLNTGRIKASDYPCVVCDLARGYVYAGTPEGREEFVDSICPWCIADGSAHDKLDVEFVNPFYIGYGRGWEPVSAAVKEEVAYRTPGFAAWQYERWFTHCADAAAFVGAVGCKELLAAGLDAIKAIQRETVLRGGEWFEFFQTLEREGSPTAYLFRCLHCGKYGGFLDSN